MVESGEGRFERRLVRLGIMEGGGKVSTARAGEDPHQGAK